MKIAIVGTGISGLGLAYMLNPHHDITVYEKNTYLGGHSRTLNINHDGADVPVDTGFIVYNEKNYFHLTRLFAHLGVETQKSNMSFGISINKGWLEYSSNGLFAQIGNVFRPKFWGMIFDILKFNQTALKTIKDNPDISLGDFLDKSGAGDWFRRYYLQAMGAAIWSCSVDTILRFPAKSFLNFFENHGLLTINGHPQWYTVTGGSKSYVKKLTSSFQNKIKTNCGVSVVKRNSDGVAVTDTNGQTQIFDKIVFACHADEALSMISDASTEERSVLESFSYQPNEVVLHGDDSFMPQRKKCWASWVYLSEGQTDSKPVVSLTYWMNNLQNLQTKNPVLVTLNPGRAPEPSKVYNRHVFTHPVFDERAVKAQEKIPAIQGQNHTYFCGAYQRNGFHEDGLWSAVRVAKLLGIDPPWI